jgi:hypothetical protein
VNLRKWLDLPMAATVTRGACLERFTEMSEQAPTQANGCMVYLRALCNHARDMYAGALGKIGPALLEKMLPSRLRDCAHNSTELA